MKLLFILLFLSTGLRAQPLKRATEAFSAGRYQTTINELEGVEVTDKNAGLIHYWKGISYARLQDYNEANKNFAQALKLKYEPVDIHYEYGQALFASEKLKLARFHFKESLRKRFKRGVCLYYMGYISRELGEKKTAFQLFKRMDRLTQAERDEVEQAGELQIADLYIEQVEKKRDAFRAVEGYVIPQLEKALAVNPASALAPAIKDRIIGLQRKYDLVLFNLRNGRPALNPPYFIRLAQEVGLDSNVTFAPTETTIAKSKQSSPFSRTDVLGRYTFYIDDYFSVSPELRFNYTYYTHRIPEIYRNDNYFLAPALRTAYEHTYDGKPASLLFDYEYGEARRDVEAKKELVFSSRSHTLMLGERLNVFERGETIVRLRHRNFESYVPSLDSKTLSLVLEQIIAFKQSTLLFYGSYDRTRVSESIYDTDALTVRGDLIFDRVRDWFTPSLGFGITRTDPINNQKERGVEYLVNPSARLSRTIGQRWRGTLKYDYMKNGSKDETNFQFVKSIYSFELEYLF